MNSEEFLQKEGIEDRILNKEDLPEYWVRLSELLDKYHTSKTNDASVHPEEETFYVKGRNGSIVGGIGNANGVIEFSNKKAAEAWVSENLFRITKYTELEIVKLNKNENTSTK